MSMQVPKETACTAFRSASFQSDPVVLLRGRHVLPPSTSHVQTVAQEVLTGLGRSPSLEEYQVLDAASESPEESLAPLKLIRAESEYGLLTWADWDYLKDLKPHKFGTEYPKLLNQVVSSKIQFRHLIGQLKESPTAQLKQSPLTLRKEPFSWLSASMSKTSFPKCSDSDDELEQYINLSQIVKEMQECVEQEKRKSEAEMETRRVALKPNYLGWEGVKVLGKEIGKNPDDYAEELLKLRNHVKFLREQNASLKSEISESKSHSSSSSS